MSANIQHARTPVAQEQMPKVERAFRIFHRTNPHVLRSLIELTEELHRTGARRIGMKMLFEVLRWQTMLATRGDDFKLNNNYCSYYARVLMHRRPEFRGMFQLREQDHKFDPATVID